MPFSVAFIPMKSSFFQNNHAYILLALGQSLIGVNIVISKLLTAFWPITMLLLVRFSLSSLLLLICHLLQSRKASTKTGILLSTLTPKQWGSLCLQSLCAGAFFNLFILAGLHYTSASMAGIITSALPAFVVVFSVLFLKEKLTRNNLLCLVIVVLSLLLINSPHFFALHNHRFWGDLLILLALVPEAGFYVLNKRFPVHLPLFLYSTLLNVINLPVFLGIAFWHGDFHGLQFSLTICLLLIASTVATVGFYLCWQYSAPKIPGKISALFTALTPIAAVIIAWAWLHETLTTAEFLGMLLVLCAIVVNSRRADLTVTTKVIQEVS